MTPAPGLEFHLAAALDKTRSGSKHRPVVYLAAVSGGADSTAMLAGLAAQRRETDLNIHCVHVEHGIRPAEESRGDALAVENLCKKLEVPYSVISIPPGKIAAYASKGGPGIEAAARLFRYKALREERRRIQAGWILTAHTRDDLLETILMRVLRGSGPAGLAPMPQTRGRLLRPLLALTRQDILEYLKLKNIPYRIDSTNEDISLLRNRLRLKLIPVLDEFFPAWRSSLLSLAETQALTAEFLASEVFKLLSWEKEAKKPGKPMSLKLKEADFMAAPQILREEAVFAGVDIFAKKGGRKTSVPRRFAVRRAVGLGSDLGPVRLEKQGAYIYLTQKDRPAAERGFSLLIKETGSYTLKGGVLGTGNRDLNIKAAAPEKNPCNKTAFLAQLPLVFRFHKDSDCIRKNGRKLRLSDILDRDVYSGYTVTVTACDANGPIGYIVLGEDLLVIRGDNAIGNSLFEIKVIFGGKDV